LVSSLLVFARMFDAGRAPTLAAIFLLILAALPP
jgi:hypothetical protein